MPQVLEQVETKIYEPLPLPPEEKEPGRSIRWVSIAGFILLLAAAAGTWQLKSGSGAPKYMTATVQRGDIARTITATGTLQAVTTVQVGTQVSGTVSEVYVDFNSPVKKGQIIARLDPSQLQAQLTQARAGLAGAQTSVQASRSSLAGSEAALDASSANVERLKSAVAAAQTAFNRTQMLVNERVAARQDLDTAKATLDQANASLAQGVAQVNQARMQVAAGRSGIAQSQAQVSQAQAQVALNAVTLDRSIIRSPIDGVIVSRNVDPGQTVAASLNTPTLFLIANDLTQMQVLANIDEADVGQLTPESKVTFTVDAFPSETFTGKIAQIRLAPQTVQNVVTYTAVVSVANPEGKLRPGMTANITATVAERNDVLTVPNAALRFRPANAPVRGEGKKARGDSGRVVWRVNGENLEPVRLTPGITDGSQTEVVKGDLHEGDAIVLADTGAQKRGPQQTTSSPFTPQRGGGRR